MYLLSQVSFIMLRLNRSPYANHIIIGLFIDQYDLAFDQLT